MSRFLNWFLCVVILVFTSFACSANNDVMSKKIKRVIYITVDGIRWQDVLQQKENMPLFWKKYAKEVVVYGGVNKTHTMEVASTPISLPSYQSQMAGIVTPCLENECGRIETETFPEKLVKSFHLIPADVASISCWEVMDDAIEKEAGTIFSNNGTRPMVDPYTHQPDPEMEVMNAQQQADYPGDDTRPDKNTYDQALHYLVKYQPKFLWISFGDADNYAHDGKRTEYLQTITFYDHVLDELVKTLKGLGLYDETMIIITTDHGRGNGEDWKEHGDEYPGSKQTFAFVFNGELIPDNVDGGVAHYSTLSIRPTVEKVFSS